MRYNERRGHLPLMEAKTTTTARSSSDASTGEEDGQVYPEKTANTSGPTTKVKDVKV